MSTIRENARQHPKLFLLLLALALWLGWKVVVAVYEMLNALSLAFFTRLDASYGQLGGWPGYALLGLGLGAAAGAIAAQQRFRLNRLILVGAVVLLVALAMGALAGSPDALAALPMPTAAPVPEPVPPATEVTTATAEPAPAAEAPTPAKALVIAENYANLDQPDRRLVREVYDYLAQKNALAVVDAPAGYLDFEAWIQDDAPMLRVQQYLRQQPDAEVPELFIDFQQALLAGVPPPETADTALPAPAPVADAPTHHATKPPAPVAAEPAEAAAPVLTHSTGHQEYSGHIGARSATYSLDWQPKGEVSGSYYYDEKPDIVYRLTGALAANGELRLLEFTRGRQSARCVLQPQGTGYAGTMHTPDGQDVAINLE